LSQILVWRRCGDSNPFSASQAGLIDDLNDYAGT